MQVIAVTKYKYKGEEYNSLEEIKEKLHDKIGIEVIDKINRVCPPQKHSDLFNLLDVLCKPEVRKTLKECYSVEFEREIEDSMHEGETEKINILDI